MTKGTKHYCRKRLCKLLKESGRPPGGEQSSQLYVEAFDRTVQATLILN
jgi:hypothetical protein